LVIQFKIESLAWADHPLFVFLSDWLHSLELRINSAAHSIHNWSRKTLGRETNSGLILIANCSSGICGTRSCLDYVIGRSQGLLVHHCSSSCAKWLGRNVVCLELMHGDNFTLAAHWLRLAFGCDCLIAYSLLLTIICLVARLPFTESTLDPANSCRLIHCSNSVSM